MKQVLSRNQTRPHTLEAVLSWGIFQLKGLGKIEARASAERLLEEVLGCDRFRLYLETKRLVPKSLAGRYRQWIGRRKKREPVDYLIGKTHFWNEVLKVGPGCLIPRPSTEVLVEKFIANSQFGNDRAFSFLDLGCGSGAIGIALLRYYPKARGTFADISAEALKITRRNLEQYALLKRAKLLRSDLFSGFQKAPQRWDAILCNPPYLSDADMKIAQPEIRREPLVALHGGRKGIEIYKTVIDQAPSYIKKDGLLVFEMGKGQVAPIKKWCGKSFPNLQIFKDYANIDRVLIARRHG